MNRLVFAVVGSLLLFTFVVYCSAHKTKESGVALHTNSFSEVATIKIDCQLCSPLPKKQKKVSTSTGESYSSESDSSSSNGQSSDSSSSNGQSR